MLRYDIGEPVTISALYRNTAGVITNPTTVTLRYRNPAGTVTVKQQADLTNPSTGLWTYNITPDQSGVWWYRFEGTGAAAAIEEHFFYVRVRRVAAA
jgi:hypothetical protein